MRYLLCSSLILLWAFSALAENVLSNPYFDTGLMLDGWQNANSTSWSSMDREDNLSSGSVEIPTNPFAAPDERFEIWSCAPVVGGKEYQFGVSVFIPGGQVAGLRGKVAVQWFDGPNCDFQLDVDLGQTEDLQTSVAGEWVDLAGTAVAPLGALGGLARLGTINVVLNSDVVHFDNVLLPEPDSRPLSLVSLLTLFLLSRIRLCRQ